MLEWILYACASAFLLGLTPVFMRAGARRTAPVVGALVFAFLALLFAAGVVVLNGVTPSLSSFDRRTVQLLVLAGALTALSLLGLFRALATGETSLVVPVLNLRSVLLYLVSRALFQTPVGLWRLCFMVLILLGTVLMECGPHPQSGKLWYVFAALAAAFGAAAESLLKAGLPLIDPLFSRAASLAVAVVLLLVAALFGRKKISLSGMGAESWLYLVLSGVTVGVAWLAAFYSSQYGEWSMLLPVTCSTLLFAIVFSRICHRERISGAARLGLVLVLLGMFALMLNL